MPNCPIFRKSWGNTADTAGRNSIHWVWWMVIHGDSLSPIPIPIHMTCKGSGRDESQSISQLIVNIDNEAKFQ